MSHYEYKVIPAPSRGEKGKGARSPEVRFAQAIEAVLNRYGESGWEYVRAELLPSEERAGLTGTTTQWRTMLIFRKAQAAADAPPVMPRIESVENAQLSVGATRAAGSEAMPPLQGAARDGAGDDTVLRYPDPEDR
jgi:hypothetical protein